MNDNDALERAQNNFVIIKTTLESFKKCRLHSLTAATKPTTPKVVFKLLAYRESLMWRILELAAGSLNEFEIKNALSGLIISRSLQETAAACHYFSNKIEQCVKEDSVDGLDETAMKLLLGSRWKDWEFSSVNVLSMIDKVEKAVPGFRKIYDDLSEYVHPNYSGVALCFSKPTGKYDIELGVYPRGLGRHLFTASQAMIGSLMLFEHSYNQSAETMLKLAAICTRDLETNSPAH